MIILGENWIIGENSSENLEHGLLLEKICWMLGAHRSQWTWVNPFPE